VLFNLIDRNGDGAVDKTEAAALTDAIFATLDTDRNGTLSAAELASGLARMHGGMGRMDRMERFDRGHHGFGGGPGGYGGRDMRHGPHHAHRHGGRGPMAPPTGSAPPQTAPGQQGGMGGGMPMPMMPAPGQQGGMGGAAPMPMMPGNQTGQSADPRSRMFSWLDTNGDGFISPEEFQAARMPPMGGGDRL
jgi:hypothetical protein